MSTLRRRRTPLSRVQRRAQREEAMHHIRNNMTVVLGFSRLLARRADQRLPAGWMVDRLNRIHAAADHVIARAAELNVLYDLEDQDDSAAPDEPDPPGHG